MTDCKSKMGRVIEGTDSCQLYCYVIFYHFLYESDGHLFGAPLLCVLTYWTLTFLSQKVLNLYRQTSAFTDVQSFPSTCIISKGNIVLTDGERWETNGAAVKGKKNVLVFTVVQCSKHITDLFDGLFFIFKSVLGCYVADCWMNLRGQSWNITSFIFNS